MEKEDGKKKIQNCCQTYVYWKSKWKVNYCV